jgi:hypothetical protein
MMAYQNGFVATIICNNKPLREFQKAGVRTCKIPFDSEYSVRLINRSKGRSFAKISIDGTDVITGDRQFLIPQGGTVDVERFVDDLKAGSKFKFISIEQGMATGEIQDPGSPDNGIIEVTFYPEIIRDVVFTSSKRKNRRDHGCTRSTTDDPAPIPCSATMDFMVLEPQSMDLPDTPAGWQSIFGATVEGGESRQKFDITNETFRVGTPIIIKIKLEAPAEVLEYGVYVSGGTKPVKTFWDKRSAALYLADNDFGDAPVTVKPV